VHIKYEAYDVSQVQVAVKGQIVSLPAAFSPWILTPTYFHLKKSKRVDR
jgi:hypothetical protein